VSPFTCLWLQYLGLFYPFILGINLVFFIVFLVFKQWKTGLVFLGVFLLCSVSIYTYFPLHQKTKEIPANCVKILTYNVMRFDVLKKHTRKQPNPIIQYILDQDADIVCIQEYGVSAKSNSQYLSHGDILTIFKSYPYIYVEPFKPSGREKIYGSAIFSKYPILKTKKIPYDSEYNGSFVAELDIQGKKVTLINNHLESNKLSSDERTGYYDMTKEINTEKLENALLKAANLPELDENEVVVTNLRHYEALTNALKAIERVETGLQSQLSGDFIAQDIRECMHYLGEITGEISTDEVLGNIFKNFCIGK
jgi:endonuclease/exonuclease/phosphatase family metal-dependent hydrolase